MNSGPSPSPPAAATGRGATGGGAEAMAQSFGAPFLGRVPLEPTITQACEAGASYAARTAAAGARNVLRPIVDRLLELTRMNNAGQRMQP